MDMAILHFKMVTENKVDFNHPGRITVRFRSPIGTGMWLQFG